MFPQGVHHGIIVSGVVRRGSCHRHLQELLYVTKWFRQNAGHLNPRQEHLVLMVHFKHGILDSPQTGPDRIDLAFVTVQGLKPRYGALR